MKTTAFILVMCFAAAAAAAQQPAVPLGGGRTYVPLSPRYSRYYFSFSGGASMPVGGHWGDGAVGFRASPSFALSGAKKVDETLSYGVETSYSFGHKNEDIGAMLLRMFSLTPFLRVAYPAGNRTYYGILGAGIYHWTQPSFNVGAADYSSDSRSSLGINMGGGAIFPLRNSWKIGAELRWHHILNMKGDNFDVDIANNLAPSILLLHGF
jgi:opacity protein-like surface antigen